MTTWSNGMRSRGASIPSSENQHAVPILLPNTTLYYKTYTKHFPVLYLLPVVPARGGAEVALKIYIRPFSSIELARAVRQPSPCVRALCETDVVFLHVTLEAPRHTSHLTVFTLHPSQSTLHTSHFTLHSPQSTLHTPHSTLHTSQSTLHTSHFSLLSSNSTLHTSHCTLHAPLFTLHTSSHLSSSHLIPAHLFSSHLFSYVI